MVAGGYTDSGGQSYRFNDVTSVTSDLVSWTPLTASDTPPSIRYSMPSVSIQGQTDDINGIYIIGGADSSQGLRDIYRLYNSPGGDQSESKSSKTTIIIVAVVVPIVIVSVVIIGIIAYLYYRRQNGLRELDVELKAKTNSDALRSQFIHRATAEKWSLQDNLIPKTPEEMGIALSKTTLNFGLADEYKLEIGKTYEDSFIISNQAARSTSRPMDVRFYYPNRSHKFTLECKSDSDKIKAGRSINVQVSLTVHCSTTVEIFIAVSIEDVGYTKVLINRTSALSTYLDYEDITLESDPIGEGAYSKVYSGQWRGTEVAVKLLKNQHLSELELQDFERETALMNSLRHPNILNFIGSVNTLGHLCFVTELIKLGSLDAVLKKHEVNLKLKCRFIVDMAKAMRFLHSSGILHRDLKPDNFLVVSLSSRAEVNIKLADFGTSRAISLLKEKHYTKAIGTPVYMSPEVLNNEEYNTPADVYSFAILLLQVMTEDEPYKDMIYAWDVAAFVTSGNRPAVPNFIPDKISKLIMNCWHQNPKERPSFEEIYKIAREAQDEVESMSRTPRSSKNDDNSSSSESDDSIEVDLPDW